MLNNSAAGHDLAFVVVSHRNPAQVVRLASRILADLPGTAILIHHDQSKSPLEKRMLPAGNVDLVDAFVAAEWGGGSLVRLTVRCLETIVRQQPEAKFVVLLSGQDYPLRDLAALPAHLERSGDGYLDVEPENVAEPLRYALRWYRLPQALQSARMQRLFDRFIFHLNGRQRYVRFANGRLGCCVGLRWKTPFPRGWRVYQGSQWWTLSRRAIDAFLRVKNERPQIYRWFAERTIIPDEGLFQTVLHNDPALHFAPGPDRFIRWDDRNSGSPATFESRDCEALAASGFFFARKFDEGIDAEIFDLLDARARARA